MSDTALFTVRLLCGEGTPEGLHVCRWWDNFMEYCNTNGSSRDSTLAEELRPFGGNDIPDSKDTISFNSESDYLLFLLKFA